MKNNVNSVKITLWANRFVALLLAVLLFTMPLVLDWYCQYRVLTEVERVAIIAAFYCCAVVVAVALWNMEKMLVSIGNGDVFTLENVRRLRAVQWCCGGTGLICVPAAFCYYPLVFMVIIMGFLFLVISVVSQVMDAAVSIREENDLTI